MEVLNRTILLDFNAPNYDRPNGTPTPNTYYYNKRKSNLVHTTVCFLCLNKHNDSVSNSALLDLFFSNIRDLIVYISNYSVVSPDSYLSPLVFYCQLTFECPHISPVYHHNSAQGDYFLLFNTYFRLIRCT
jgi:hypothetical protein